MSDARPGYADLRGLLRAANGRGVTAFPADAPARATLFRQAGVRAVPVFAWRAFACLRAGVASKRAGAD